MALRWAHAVVYVRDLPAMIDFYERVLDFEVTDRGPVGPGEDAPEIVFLSQVPTDHHQLAFLPIRQGDERPNSVDHFAFRVDSLDEVRSFIERLEKDGRASELLPLTHGNAWSIYFRDPEKNGIEIFSDTPWHVAQPQGRRWDTQLSNQELADWTHKEFEGETRFGPIDAFYAKRAKDLEGR